LSLCLTKYHVIKTHAGVEIYIHAFLTSALDVLVVRCMPPVALPTGKEPQ